MTTQAILFSLIYGIKVILSIELKIPSVQIALIERLSIKQSLIDWLEQLEDLDDAGKKKNWNIKAIQERRKIAFDKRYIVKTLKVDMLVLL